MGHEIQLAESKSKKKESSVIKMLLLGAGESGKSTIFKQISHLYYKQLSIDDQNDYLYPIFQNCLTSIQTLIKESRILADEGLKTGLPPVALNAAEALLQIHPGLTAIRHETSERIKLVWSTDEIQLTYKYRSRFQLPDCTSYFLNQIDEIGKKDYIPSIEDTIRCRIPTSSIIERRFTYDGRDFLLLDVGGQRNERRKWIHQFEGLSAVLFVASLSDYDEVLYEDASSNRMIESLILFEKICSMEWFTDSNIVLFLNKSDLFERKIAEVDLRNTFPDYEGGSDYKQAIAFITKKFLEKNHQGKVIVSFVTSAINTVEIKTVFTILAERIIIKRLRGLDLIN